MIALVQHRSGNTPVAKAILASLRETAISSEELGMYWKENTGGMYWNQADIETQALLIEAFAEIEGNDGIQYYNAKDHRRTAVMAVEEQADHAMENHQGNHGGGVRLADERHRLADPRRCR